MNGTQCTCIATLGGSTFKGRGTDANNREFASREEAERIQTVTPVRRVTSEANVTDGDPAACTSRTQLSEIRVLAP